MSLLQAIENYLGDVGTWPSYIIKNNLPLRQNAFPKVVEELTTFFAGNGMPKTLVRQLFYTRFSLWHSSDTIRRHSMYYDVCIKQHVWLHVPYFTELLAIKEKTAKVPGW